MITAKPTQRELILRALQLVPINLRDARAFCAQVHRHHLPPTGGLFAVACATEDRIVGVAIIGRPVARNNQDDWTAEVTRVATDGTPNACSILYAAAWRACRALGYRRLLTYTLTSEPGTSMVAAGWRTVGETTAQSWHRENRPRVDRYPLQAKLVWERTA